MSVEDLLEQLRKQLTALPDREPSSEQARVRSLARAVAGMPETSPDCEACQRELPGFLDDERARVPLEQRSPTVRRHLLTCPTCSLLYAQLLEMAQLETLPYPRHGPDLSFLEAERAEPSVAELLQELVTGLAQGVLEILHPAHLADLPVVSGIFFEKALADLKTGVTLRPVQDVALAFGGELPFTVQVLAAICAATIALAQQRMTVSSPQLAKVAAEAARKYNLSRAQAKEFAEAYLQALSEREDALRELSERWGRER